MYPNVRIRVTEDLQIRYGQGNSSSSTRNTKFYTASERALPGEKKAGATVQQQDSTMLEALANCSDFECLRTAHTLPRGSARFNFPHFLIIGWQKAGTTSLHR